VLRPPHVPSQAKEMVAPKYLVVKVDHLGEDYYVGYQGIDSQGQPFCEIIDQEVSTPGFALIVADNTRLAIFATYSLDEFDPIPVESYEIVTMKTRFNPREITVIEEDPP
jgi:hypothetical protein